MANDENGRDKQDFLSLGGVYTSFVTDFHLFICLRGPPLQLSPWMITGDSFECFQAWLQVTTKI